MGTSSGAYAIKHECASTSKIHAEGKLQLGLTENHCFKIQTNTIKTNRLV